MPLFGIPQHTSAILCNRIETIQCKRKNKNKTTSLSGKAYEQKKSNILEGNLLTCCAKRANTEFLSFEIRKEKMETSVKKSSLTFGFILGLQDLFFHSKNLSIGPV